MKAQEYLNALLEECYEDRELRLHERLTLYRLMLHDCMSDGPSVSRSSSHLAADGPPGGRIFFNPGTGEPSGRSRNYRRWRG